MTDPVAVLLDRLEGVRTSGRGWDARCPGHEDRHASLSIAAGDDGRALLTCHAGCSAEAVVEALGLGMADLYPRTNGAAGPPRPARGRGQETRYRVRLADGSHPSERIEHVRLDRPNGTKRIWWERDGRKGLGGLSSSTFALYGIDRVDPGTTGVVVIVEGEKVADALSTLGIPAVGTVTGAAATPCREALLPLTGRPVVLWPDADDAGMAHMQGIARALDGIASSISWVTPPDGVEAGWDAADAEPEQASQLIGEASAGEALPIMEAIILPPPSAPMPVARRLVDDRFVDASGTTVIRAWRGGFSAWDGRCWPDRDIATVRAEAYGYLEHAVYGKSDELRPWEPTKSKVANVLEALAAVTHLPPTVQPPTWLVEDEELPAAKDLVVTANGILHVPDRRMLPHDARLFVGHSVPFDYDPDAAEPARWLAFLDDLRDRCVLGRDLRVSVDELVGDVEGLGRGPVAVPRDQADLRPRPAGGGPLAPRQPTTRGRPSPGLQRRGPRGRKQFVGPRTTRTG